MQVEFESEKQTEGNTSETDKSSSAYLYEKAAKSCKQVYEDSGVFQAVEDTPSFVYKKAQEETEKFVLLCTKIPKKQLTVSLKQ